MATPKKKPDPAAPGAPGDPPADVTRADLAGAAGTGDVGDGEAEFDHPLKGDPALKDARAAADEIQRLREENAALKAGVPLFEPGRRYHVSIKDAVAWVVEPAPGEHPFEAYKRATGVLASVHAPQISPTDLPVGRVAA